MCVFGKVVLWSTYFSILFLTMFYLKLSDHIYIYKVDRLIKILEDEHAVEHVLFFRSYFLFRGYTNRSQHFFRRYKQKINQFIGDTRRSHCFEETSFVEGDKKRN